MAVGGDSTQTVIPSGFQARTDEAKARLRDSARFATPKKRGTLFGIQCLRAFAALLVVIRHCAKEAAHNADSFAIGQSGVDNSSS